MNESIQTVSKGWYRLYYGFMLAVSVTILGGYILSHRLDSFASYSNTFGLDAIAAVLAGAHIVYCLTAYWVIRRYHEAIAMLGSSMLFSLVLLYGISATDPGIGSWAYVGIWLVTSLFVGIYGLQIALGSLVVPGIYMLLQYDFRLMQASPQAWVLLIGNFIIVPISYLLWKPRYVNPEATRLNELSGMLKTNQEQSAILIQSIADGVIVTDTSGKISLMNRGAANMTGWTVDEGLGVDVKTVFKVAKEKGEPISEEEYPFTAVLVHKAFINQILQLTSRNGKKQQVVSLVISPVVTSSGQVYGAVAVIRDISQQRAAEQQRAEFISTASHEMRTPVAAIEGYLALALNDKVSTIDTRARGFLDKAHASTQHLGKLFQDLLTSAKAEDGRLSSHPQVVEMGSYLEQLIEDLRFTAQKKNLLAEFVIGDTGGTIDATDDKNSLKVVKPLYYIYVDPERLREVITNLFDNAIKYTDQGKISVGLTGNGEVVQIYIKDTGQGIPTEDIPHLFQKFYRVDNSATRVIGGTGLGLFICRKIVELYQGRIWVESDLGKGSTFFINFPRVSTQKAAQLQASESAATNPPAAPSATPR